MLSLERELHVGALSRHLGLVVRIDDPYARRMIYARAGLSEVSARDDRRAADIARARRRAFSAPGPAIERSVDACGAGTRAGAAAMPENEQPRVHRAPTWARALVGWLGDVVGLATLVTGWTGAYCVLCPPAHAAARELSFGDEVFSSLVCYAPIVMGILLLLAALWADRGRPVVPDDNDGALSPSLVPDLASMEQARREADRG